MGNGNRYMIDDKSPQIAFSGGPPHLFFKVGHGTMAALETLGMTPASRVLDFGCGCLRVGRLLISYLNPGNYYGIEANEALLEEGKALWPHLADRNPTYHIQDKTDVTFGPWNTTFDFIVMRSVWSHWRQPQIRECMAHFATRQDGILLTSFPFGNSKTLPKLKTIRHGFPKLCKIAKEDHNLSLLKFNNHNVGNQRWVILQHQGTPS
jgi:SAM-dependent methyltransferase